MKLFGLIFLILNLLAYTLMAQGLASKSKEPTFHQKVIDTSTEGKKYVSVAFRSLSAEVDSFFSSRRTSYLTNQSELRVYYLTTLKEFDGLSGGLQADAHIVLPETEKKLHLIFERRPRRLESPETPGDINLVETPDDQKQYKTAAGIRYFLFFDKETTVTTDAGIQFEAPLQPFTRLRVGHSFFISKTWELRFAEEPYYFFIDRWRFVTTLDSDHTLSSKVLFRIGNELTWNQVSTAFDYLYGPSLFQKISDTRGISYHFKILARSQPAWQNNDLIANVIYRQLIIKDWFFYELIPALEFPRSRDWHMTPSISVRLEAIF